MSGASSVLLQFETAAWYTSSAKVFGADGGSGRDAPVTFAGLPIERVGPPRGPLFRSFSLNRKLRANVG